MPEPTHEFDRPYWERHWHSAHRAAIREPNPYLARETRDLTPGTALDAGCGEGAEARWLAARGWTVTAADISAGVLARCAEAAPEVDWVRADLTTWTPATPFDLVMTHYAHPAIPQLDFYQRIAGWVAPGGTLLVVGHRPGAGHGHHPAEATATAAATTARLDPVRWQVVTADEPTRTRPGRAAPLHDVVVRAHRRN
ncbi:class I SAM-dependent methyltransferase [Amycolatopsis sp. PS_44_ISF1]|uniref:class I SAM-dependent methyltransferase n=1 Tax=Amycolatopsis sp. PS_44_ISF1 TaxID=2974917 RepID=UPI0028DE5450|nr:class I SAM-dependent methyltransferase [Amycolatopsis sp. PS_44_ISF1]MDT8911419.1 class I SAM-dependent methyltransferase [Amycolatopsis sp. PS_44_ISF1]